MDIDLFDSPNDAVPSKMWVKFETKSILKKAIYMLVVKNSFEFAAVRSNCTSFNIWCKDLSSSWYLRAFVLKKKVIFGLLVSLQIPTSVSLTLLKMITGKQHLWLFFSVQSHLLKWMTRLHVALLIFLITWRLIMG